MISRRGPLTSRASQVAYAFARLGSLNLFLATILLGMAPHAVIAQPAKPAVNASTSAPSEIALDIVPNERVCMVTNRVFAETQIPIAVGDKTYYGCCDMCREKLGSDPASRTAIDPVSGKSIDKAVAVIGAKPSGEVIYFESLESLKAFKSGKRS